MCNVDKMCCCWAILVVFVFPNVMALSSSLFLFGQQSLLAPPQSQCTVGTPSSACTPSTSCFTCSSVELRVTPNAYQPLKPITAQVTSACTGQFHSLMRFDDGSVIGFGPAELLGLNVTSTGQLSNSAQCKSGTILKTTTTTSLPQGAASAVACRRNLSAVVLTNGSVVVFGEVNPATTFGGTVTKVLSAPVALETLLGISTQPPLPPAAAVGVAYDSVLVLLSNGSLITTGYGVLSGVAAVSPSSGNWWRTVLAPCPASCGRATGMQVGLQHAVILCANGCLVGLGDNSVGQLGFDEAAVPTVTLPTLLNGDWNSSSSHPNRTVEAVAVGLIHTLILTRNSSLQNSTQLLHFAGKGEITTRVSGFQELEVSAITGGSSTRIVSIAAGDNAFLAVTSPLQKSIGTNLFGIGGNSRCPLGPYSPANGTLQWGLIPFDFRRRMTAQRVFASDSGRTLVSASTTSTMSATFTLTVSSSMTATSTVSKTASLSRLSVSPSRTNTPSLSLSQEASVTAKTATLWVTRTRTIMLPPRIVSILWLPSANQLWILFNIDTNTPNKSVDSMFQVSGAGQNFGIVGTYSGAWQTTSRYVIVLSSTARIDVGIAVVAAVSGNGIRALGSTEGAGEVYSATTIPVKIANGELDPVPPETSFGPSRGAIIGGSIAGGVIFLILLAIVVWAVRTLRKRGSPRPELRGVSPQRGPYDDDDGEVRGIPQIHKMLPPTAVATVDGTPSTRDEHHARSPFFVEFEIPQSAESAGENNIYRSVARSEGRSSPSIERVTSSTATADPYRDVRGSHAVPKPVSFQHVHAPTSVMRRAADVNEELNREMSQLVAEGNLYRTTTWEKRLA